MLVYKMNQLLLLGGLVLALYVMNEKKMFKDVSKTLSSGKNNTMLVLVFCGVILFMCMQKGKVMEYFSLLEENSDDCGLNKKLMHIFDPNNNPEKHLPICVENVSESERLINGIEKLGVTTEPSVQNTQPPVPSPEPEPQPSDAMQR